VTTELVLRLVDGTLCRGTRTACEPADGDLTASLLPNVGLLVGAGDGVPRVLAGPPGTGAFGLFPELWPDTAFGDSFVGDGDGLARPRGLWPETLRRCVREAVEELDVFGSPFAMDAQFTPKPALLARGMTGATGVGAAAAPGGRRRSVLGDGDLVAPSAGEKFFTACGSSTSGSPTDSAVGSSAG